MKSRLKVFFGICVAIVTGGALAVYLFPQIAATCTQYFDINNGRVKLESVSFGRVYRDSVQETGYSKLLKQFGLEELPTDWKPTNSVELGIRRLLETQHVHHKYAKLPADATTFAAWLQLQETMSEQEKRENLNTFRALVRKGTPETVHEYVNGLQQTARK